MKLIENRWNNCQDKYENTWLADDESELNAGFDPDGAVGSSVCVISTGDVWIKNSKGQWLISQRAASRPTFPLMWECVGGSVTAGEDSLTGAIREAKEEVGVDLEPEQGKRVNTTIREHFQDIKDDWVFVYDGEIDLRKATTDEVADMRWMTVEEIRALFEAGELVHTLGYFFDDPQLGGQA